MKKKKTLGQTVTGILIGFVLIVASPIAMWQAQNQDSAKEFDTSKEVTVDSNEPGYIEVRGSSEYVKSDGGKDCYQKSCLYENASFQELKTTTKRECTESVTQSDTVRVLGRDGSSCDENNDCTPCWTVERDSWEQVREETLTYGVKVGNYVATPQDGTKFLDVKKTTLDTGFSDVTFNPTRTVYKTFVKPDKLLVAGRSDGTVITKGDKPFVFSSYDRQTTFDRLQAQDKAAQKMLWIATFLMLFFGITLILGPLTWFGSQFRFVPIFGKMLSQGSSAIVTLVSFILAIPLWIVLFVVVNLLQMWWLGIILVVGIVAFFIWKAKNDASFIEKPGVENK